MTDRLDFEGRLEARLLAHAARADRLFDPVAISASVAARTPRRPWTVGVPRRSYWRGSNRSAMALAIVILTALLIGTMALVGARLLTHQGPLGGLIAVAYEDRLELADADGSNPRIIRDGGPFFDPRWSHDGLYLAVRDAPVGFEGTLHILRSDGTEVGQITTTLSVRWSPDDDRLLARKAERGLDMLQTDGSVIETFGIGSALSTLDAFAWAGDETIVRHFTDETVVGRWTRKSGRTSGENFFLPSPFADVGPTAIYLADTSTNDRAGFLAWGDCAATGTECQGLALFALAGVSGDVDPVDRPAGSVLVDDVERPICDSNPISPAGSALLFERTVDGVRSIFRAAADGSRQIRLTSGPFADRCPRWSPDGGRILFLRSTSTGTDVWAMEPDGSGQVRVAADATGADLQPTADQRPTASDPPLTAPGFVGTGSMTSARADATAVLLADGRVLIVGGWTARDGVGAFAGVSSAEIYDPVTGSFSPTGSMAEGRVSPSATLLADGRVLVAGGFPFESMNVGPAPALASAELYDPATGTFSPTGSMAEGRAGHTAVQDPVRRGPRRRGRRRAQVDRGNELGGDHSGLGRTLRPRDRILQGGFSRKHGGRDQFDGPARWSGPLPVGSFDALRSR